METIPKEILDRAVAGTNLAKGSFRAQLEKPVTLLVFLRHFG